MCDLRVVINCIFAEESDPFLWSVYYKVMSVEKLKIKSDDDASKTHNDIAITK